MLRNQYNKQERRLRKLLKNRRTELGLTQSKLSSQMGMARTFVSKYETGERILTFTEVKRICDLLSLDMGQLMEKIAGYDDDDEFLDLEAAEELHSPDHS